MTDPFEQALWEVMCLAFFFLMRRSEIVANSGGSFKWFAVRAQDIAVLDVDGRLTLSPAKAHSVCIRLVDAIKRAAIKTGKDSRHFSSHSLRAGDATHMYRSGTDALTIQFHGRWMSDAFKTYTRLCKESVATLSASMVSGSRGDSTLH
ncbi:hypothetical protein BBI17_009881 [Phytophthora kernoviae]|uniref:Tyr recombinase domain-containing protein n=1 Tax=Phytophthora kernoviae TaxID=325452 RepID=A0A3R7H9C3_9STRA|nr:hypothetical protein BBI17_009881 [Phytophthora kernoviae]